MMNAFMGNPSREHPLVRGPGARRLRAGIVRF
jgi:hypothetical protein